MHAPAGFATRSSNCGYEYSIDWFLPQCPVKATELKTDHGDTGLSLCFNSKATPTNDTYYSRHIKVIQIIYPTIWDSYHVTSSL